MKYKYVVFDIDGTLIDTRDYYMKELQRLIKEYQGRDVSMPELRPAFGIPGQDGLRAVGFKEEDLERMETVWGEYIAESKTPVKIFDGVTEVLEELIKTRKLGIVTSKNADEFNTFGKFGLNRFFDTAVIKDDTEAHKPRPEPILKYLERVGADKSEALYIGDTIFDMKCAQAAGVDCALALWGSVYKPSEVAADYYFNTPAEILEALADSAKS
jgi:HAD superfamily hydrolase (TIGR01549 family)